ncbi:MAG: Glucosamine-phosphate N-acetyltransferase-like protein [Watsoniomyces obsoletus]|nr:MAG: Glucosamine-phosphate N-acetyltransferase-like protein [Watsoniomyces obsoletus]
MSDSPLFDPSLISPTVSSSLPESYTIRPLQQSDYHAGFLDVLRVLTTVGEVTEERWKERYEWMRRRNEDIEGNDNTSGDDDKKKKVAARGEYFILIIWDGKKVVGTGTLLVEKKFIHELGSVGHIEDIAVAKDQQGKKLGLRMIQALDALAENVGCYKSILDCSEANEGFYVKCGFKRAGLEMAHYYEGPKASKA